MTQLGGYQGQPQVDREYMKDLAIAKISRTTTLMSAGIAVAAALLSSLLTLLGVQLNGQQARRQYLLEEKKEAYAEFYASLRIVETNTDTYAGNLLARTRLRSASLTQAEVTQEITTLYNNWAADAKDVHKASGNLRIVAGPGLVDLAAKCSATLTVRESDLLGIVERLAVDINAGNAELAQYVTHADSALYGDECRAFTDAAKRDIEN